MARIPALVFTIAVAVTLLLVPPVSAQTAPAAGTGQPPWIHPVQARIVDFFRPPAGPYGAGNRGLEYDTRPGQTVVAVAAGTVVFAGSVGGDRYVVVAHSPELRSTYAYLEAVEVSVGEAVAGGQRIATAARHFHLTARLHNRYVDPLGYLSSAWSVRLVAIGSGRRLVG